MITQERWNAAQTAEAANWQDAASRSSRLLYELTEHSEAAKVIPRYLNGREDLNGMEVGIGPLGMGFLAVHAAGYFGRLIGLEPLSILNVNLPDRALQDYVKAVQSRVDVVQAKGEAIPFGDETFDVMCCINVIDHAQHPDAILQEIRRVTKGGGVFIFGVNTLSFPGRVKWRLLRRIRPSKSLFIAHPHIYGWKQTRGRLQRQGWTFAWDNRPSLWQRLAGHGRMSFWILERQTVGSECV